MVRTVAKYFLLGLIVLLILIWLVSGGIGKIKSAAGDFSNPLGFFGSNLYGGTQLPFGVPIPQGVDISKLVNGQQTSSGQTSQASQASTFGNASSYANQISISADGANASDPQQEYVAIQNTGAATIDISGWSLQSALTGARAYLPLGASFFGLGEINSQTEIELPPGGVAIVTSGTSPVGTSFRINECSGYLEQLQHYTPPIQTQCPSPSNASAQAAQYGQPCADYVSSIPFCTFPQTTPAGLSAQCAAYIQNTFSYNGCVAQYRNDTNFATDDWRVYLDAAKELWQNDHDTIRLLDSQGETVAVTSY